MRNRKLKILSLFILVIFVFSLSPAFTSLAATTTSGKCGDDIIWSYDGNGTLSISGTGDMYDFDSYKDNVPWKKYKLDIQTVVFFGDITSIGDLAFVECYNLKNIELPDSVTRIGNDAFAWCEGLKEFPIPDSVNSIGVNAFSFCQSLTNIEVPYGITAIEYGTFAYCSDLKSVSIPDSVVSIGSCAFLGCNGLESISVPLSVTTIGENAFLNCSSIADVYYDGSREQFESIEGYDAFNENVTIHYRIVSLSITDQPADYTGAIGSTATFNVVAQGTGLKYQWQAYTGGKWVNSSLSGAKTSTLSVPITLARNGYKFRCVLSDSANNVVTSDEATLHVSATALTITTQPKNFAGAVGSTAKFTVAAQGTGLKYQWQAYTNGKWANSSLTGSKTATLSVPVTYARNGYKFRCIVTDSFNQTVTSKETTLNVTTTPLSIITQPKNYTGSVGSTAKFTVTATGTGLKYQWQAYTNGKWVNSSLTGSKTATLSVPVTAARNGYKFRCVITDASGKTVTSNAVTLKVATVALSITTQPKNYSGAVGSTATFKVVAQGTGLKYQWQAYSGGKWVNSSLTGCKTATLSVPVTKARNGYKFRCVITDASGKTVTSNEVTLKVVS